MAAMGVPGAPARTWVDVTGTGITTLPGTWQNRGDQEVELFFSSSSSPPAENVKGLLLQPQLGYKDETGSAYVYGRSAGSTTLVFVAD